jgi:hypothetical protein
MPSDLSIGAIAPDSAIRAAEAPRSGAAAPSASAASASSDSTSPGTPNPTLELDAALGLVVIEFLSKSGAVTTSIPTQRELTAYRDGTAEPPGTHQAQPASIHQKV